MNVLMQAMHSAATPFYHMHAQHCMTTHPTQPTVVLPVPGVFLYSLHILRARSHAPLHHFVHYFACAVLFSKPEKKIPDFFCFFHIWRDLWYFWFCAFLFVVPDLANFLIFSIFENFSFWLVFVLSCQQVWRTAIYTSEPSNQ